MWEIVAGIIDDGETPEEVARRECEEEAGLVASDLLQIGQFYTSAGGTSEYHRLYVGKVNAAAAGGLHGLIEEAEDIRVFTLAADEAIAAVGDGRIRTAPAFAALLWLRSERDNLRKRWR